MKCPHCNVHIDEHPALPCLDKWVAETMGWPTFSHRYYSCYISAAWEVVMHFKDRQYPIELTGEDAHAWSRWDCKIWHPLDDPDFTDEIAAGWDESMNLNERLASAPLAICRAAIKAMGDK